jgi:hypothetical protein
MQRLELTIKLYEGETFVIHTSASDLIKWESNFDLSIDKLAKITHLYYLAWLACKRLTKTSLEFEAWADTVEDVAVADPKGSKA